MEPSASVYELNRLTSLRARKGQLLLELLVTIGVIAVIGAVVGQIIYASLRSNQTGGEKNVAVGLAEAEFDAVRSAATGNWLNLSNLVDGTGTTVYYASSSGGAWNFATGTESVVINADTYSRSFYVQNTCRSTTASRAITGISDTGGAATSSCTTNGGAVDPSTQKVTVTISWSTGGPILYSDYVTRWRNVACAQSSWTTQTSTASTCPANTYTTSTNVTTGGNLQLCVGGC